MAVNDEQIKALFDMFDVDGGGEISVDELNSVMRMLGQNPTEEEIKELIKEADADGSGEIDFDEFRTLIRKKMEENDTYDEL